MAPRSRPLVFAALLIAASLPLLPFNALGDSSTVTLDAARTDAEGNALVVSGSLSHGSTQDLTVLNVPAACSSEGCRAYRLLAPGQNATSPGGTSGAAYAYNATAFAVDFFMVTLTPAGTWRVVDNTSAEVARFRIVAPSGLPDLAIESFTLTPDAPENLESVGVNITVRNQGTAPSPSVPLDFDVDGNIRVGFTVPPLAPGETYSTGHSDAWNARPGTHTFRALVDRLDGTPEANETNNIAVLTREVTDAGVNETDLVLVALRVLTPYPMVNEPVAVQAEFRFDGPRAVGSFGVAVDFDGAPWGGGVVEGAMPGETRLLNWTAVFGDAGDHELRVQLDQMDEIAERDETNNAQTGLFRVAGERVPPDLVLLDVGTQPGAPRAGEPTRVLALLKNNGGEPAGAFTVAFRVGTLSLGNVTVGQLAGGESITLTAPRTWHPKEGTAWLNVTADLHGNVSESNESNNGMIVPVRVAPPPLPDLVVTAVEVLNATAREGEAVQVWAAIANRGDAPADALVAFYLDGASQPFSVQFGGFMGAGAESAVLTAPFFPRAGSHTIRVVIDDNNSVREGNESNNKRFAPLEVRPAPKADLAVTIVSVEKEDVRTDYRDFRNPLGLQVVTVELCNEGDGASRWAYVNLTVETEGRYVYAERSSHAGFRFLETLAAGACETMEFEWEPLGYVGDVTFVAYAGSFGPEENFANNKDRAESFVVVGGLGGYTALPVQAPPPGIAAVSADRSADGSTLAALLPRGTR